MESEWCRAAGESGSAGMRCLASGMYYLDASPTRTDPEKTFVEHRTSSGFFTPYFIPSLLKPVPPPLPGRRVQLLQCVVSA